MLNKSKYLTGVASIALAAGVGGTAFASTIDTSALDLSGNEVGFTYSQMASGPLMPMGKKAKTPGLVLASGDISPSFGDISPFYGNIAPFYGDINPFFGNISPFFGNISPFFGDISPFYGNISPFYGNISPFFGDINPFWGNISPFWGNISPFWGDLDPFYGNINPFWGNIAPFWGNISPFWGDIEAFWGNISPFDANADDQYTELMGMFQEFYDLSEATWKDQIKDKTGKNFKKGFAKAILNKYGIDLKDPSSLGGLSAADRAAFFMDWHDNLMQFSGQDQLDYWMPMVNWRPSLTQDQGAGETTKIGLLDAKVEQGDMFDSVNFVGGYEDFTGNHGAMVASLLAAKHDGVGIMGIAPRAEIMNYNPFDKTGTTNWGDVRKGIYALAENDVRLVNMSLGVPGHVLHQGWVDVLSQYAFRDKTQQMIFVKAAGNEGIVQETDVNWQTSVPTDTLVLVGSVGPTGEISSFSNTPGTACILKNGKCDGDLLMNHFLVAPGEFMLVSDNKGSVTRMSGTSFATPLVTGTIALLYDRWPWLKDTPATAVDIVLRSARDLGAPGVDAVYGHGLLDIEASQSPLSFDDLEIYYNDTHYAHARLKTLLLMTSVLSAWETSEAQLVAFEAVGDVKRDFIIPLSTRLYGQDYSNNDVKGRFQRHVQRRMMDWASGGSLTDIKSVSGSSTTSSGWTLGFTMTAEDEHADTYDAERPFKQDMRLSNPKTGIDLQFGFGDGSIALQDREAFGFYSDYGASTGGVNPVLGFASGGVYGATGYALTKKAHLKLGFTQQTNDHTSIDATTGQRLSTAAPGVADYEAAAYMLGMDYTVSERLQLNGSYTLLDEETGLLGVQGAGALGLSGGALTDAVTFGADLSVSPTLTLAASATLAETRSTGFAGSALSVANGGIQSTAFMVAASKKGIFGKTDQMRMSLTQPLTIEDGSLTYTSYQVTDRTTGETGLVSDEWSLESANPELNAELLYARPFLDERATLSLSGMVDLNAVDTDDASGPFSLGSRMSFAF